jgi:hypothetical protein
MWGPGQIIEGREEMLRRPMKVGGEKMTNLPAPVLRDHTARDLGGVRIAGRQREALAAAGHVAGLDGRDELRQDVDDLGVVLCGANLPCTS